MKPPTFWIDRGILDDLCGQAQERVSDETGGILLGYEANGGRDVVVLDAIGPGPGAVHRHDGFEPDQSWQEKQLAAQYRTSDGVLSYVGDWHTHPGGAAMPSWRDLATLRRIARFEEARLPHPAMLIVAVGDRAMSARAWQWQPREFMGWAIWPHAFELEIRPTGAHTDR